MPEVKAEAMMRSLFFAPSSLFKFVDAGGGDGFVRICDRSLSLCASEMLL